MSRAWFIVTLALAAACSGATSPSSATRRDPTPVEGAEETPSAAAETAPEAPAPTPSTLVADFDAAFWGRLVATATGPGGLVAFAEQRRVTLVDLEARRLLGVIDLAPDPDYGMPMMARRIRSVGFIGGDRLAIGTHGIEVVDLHDTRQRELLEARADSAAAFAATDEGMYVVMSSGELIHFEGRPLVERARWRLPTFPSAGLTPTIARAGDRVFVTSQNRLFAIDGEAISEVSLPGAIGRRARLACSMGGGGELIVAIDGGRMVGLDVEELTVTQETQDGSSDYLWGLECDPARRLCYRRRARRVEVWRDDLSAILATVESNGRVDPRTGRVVQSGRDGSLLSVVDEPGQEWEPLGAAVLPFTEVEWSSRDGELIVAAGHRVFALSLDTLALTALPNVRPPIAVASDGAIIAVGELAEIVVHEPDLTERRRVIPPGCDPGRIGRLREQNSEAAWRQVERYEDLCTANLPTMIASAPTRPLLALDTPSGAVRVLDFAAGRWRDRFRPFADYREAPEVRAFGWSRDSASVEAFASRQSFVMTLGSTTVATDGHGAIVTRAENAEGVVAFAGMRGGLRLRSGDTESAIELDFEPEWVVAGPASSWAVIGEAGAALLEGGAVVATHVTGPATEYPRVRWAGAQPVMATIQPSGSVRLTRMRDGRALQVSLVGPAAEPRVIVREGDRFEASGEGAAPLHLRAGERDLLGATGPAEGSAGLARAFLEGASEAGSPP